MRNASFDSVHGSQLKYYSDVSFDAKVIMSHVLYSETGVPVARLLCLIDTEEGLMVQVGWKGLNSLEDTPEKIAQVQEDVPQLFQKLLD